jgi:CRP/FNR family transcriptional regulator, cyclic AMP receptor protein
MTERTIRDLLGEHPFFADMAAEHLDLLAGCGRNEVFPAGTVLAHQGDPAERFHVLRTGRVALSIDVARREPLVIATLGPGDVLGWSWLFPPYSWRFDVEATSETHAIGLDGVCLRAKCDADPVLGYALMRRFAQILVGRLEATRLQLVDVYGKIDDG